MILEKDIFHRSKSVCLLFELVPGFSIKETKREKEKKERGDEKKHFCQGHLQVGLTVLDVKR